MAGHLMNDRQYLSLPDAGCRGQRMQLRPLAQAAVLG
jgi:hypothetical protein